MISSVLYKPFSFYLASFLIGFQAFTAPKFSLLHYECNQISLKYGGKYDDLPSLLPLGEAELKISSFDSAIPLAQLIKSNSETFYLTIEDLHLIAEVPMQYLKSLGYEGIVVFPDPNQIDPVSGKDLRDGSKESLRILIWVSRLQGVQVKNDGIDKNQSIRINSILSNDLIFGEHARKPIKNELMRYWKRFGKSPSRSLQIVLSPGDEPGEVLSVLKLRPVDSQKLFLYGSNSGTDVTGKWMLGMSYMNNQVTGADDQMSISYSSSDTLEVQSFSLSYEKPIVYPDLIKTGINLGYSSYDSSSFAVTQFSFKGETKSIDLFTKWHPLETEFSNHSFSFEAGFRGEQTTASNSLVSGEADATIIMPKLSVQLNTKGKYLRTESKLSIYGNIHSINQESQSLLGGVKAEDRFARVTIKHFESFKIGKWLEDQFSKSFSDSLRNHLIITRFQSSLGLQNKRYLPQHQFIVGGTGSVRGYPESPIAGDKGYFISLEYRVPLPPIKFTDGVTQIKGTLIPFCDWGETFVNDPLYYERDHSILGAGVGLELNFPFGATARIDVAKPLKEIVNYGAVAEGTRSSDYRVHAMLRWEF